jgi:hypothetical protein
MPRIIGNDNAHEAWGTIVPIFTVSLAAEAKLIGTGFFVTTTGVLVTAKHVILENVGEDGKDESGIGVFQFYGDRKMVARPLTYSSLHPVYDLALCETTQFEPSDGQDLSTMRLVLTLDIPKPGTQIATHSFHGPTASVHHDKRRPLHHGRFEFKGAFETDRAKEAIMSWHSRVTAGYVRNYFPTGRDAVMLPFPCFESDTPIYGGTSGGPVFDDCGRVFAVNCSSFEGTDIAYHTHIAGLLDLELRNTVLPGDALPRTRTVRELAKFGAIAFDPGVE